MFIGNRLLRRIPCPPWWLLLCVIAAAAPGCARARADTVPSGPPLDMPAPPPRVVVPLEVAAEVPEPEPRFPKSLPCRRLGRAPTPADVPARPRR